MFTISTKLKITLDFCKKVLQKLSARVQPTDSIQVYASKENLAGPKKSQRIIISE
jgi:hypothetical protein